MKRIISTSIGIGLFAFGLMAADKPSYPGGEAALNKYLTENLKYPSYAAENGVEGVVTVGFLVMPDGSIKNAKVVKLVDPDLEKEALRLVNGMPAWVPAEEGGVSVEAPASVNVPFILE